MKSVLAFLAVSAFFFATSGVFAGVFWGLGRILQSAFPAANDEHWAWLVVGLIALSASIGFAMGSVKLIGRASRGRARARG